MIPKTLAAAPRDVEVDDTMLPATKQASKERHDGSLHKNKLGIININIVDLIKQTRDRRVGMWRASILSVFELENFPSDGSQANSSKKI